MEQPTVTVLIPTFNHARFVRETLDSVLAQDYPAFSVLVADDASTDGTADIVEEYVDASPGIVRLLRAERNLGISANFQRLVDAVDTDFYALLGGDDVMLPGKLSRQVAFMLERPTAAVCVHDAEVFVSETDEVLGRFSMVYNGQRGFREGGPELLLRPAYYTLPSTMLVRTSARPPEGYDQRLKYSQEWIYDIETFSRGGCVALDDVLVRYRRHGGSVTSSAAHREIRLEENLMVMGIVEARHPELAREVLLRRTGLFVSEALATRGEGDRAAAAGFLRAAIRTGGIVRVLRVFASYARVLAGRRLLRVPNPV